MRGRMKPRGVIKLGGRINLIGSASLVCIVLLFFGCSSGDKAREEVEWTPAEQNKARLLRQIDRKFENPDAHYQLGKLYQADGLWIKAENEYNITLGFDPVHRGAQAALVKVLLDSGNRTKTELLTDIYVNQASNSASASLELALAFQKEGLDEYALTCYQQALRLQPNSARVNRQIGYYYLSKNDRTRALDYLRRSFQLDPYQPEVAGELGRLGVTVEIPRKTRKGTKKLDRIVDQYDKEISP